MSDQSAVASDAAQPARTLAIRIPDDVRSQLDFIAQLSSRSVSEEIRLAIQHWIETCRKDPQILGRAEAVRDEIERDAASRRDAIAAFFPTTSKPASASTTKRSNDAKQ
jgi:predicted DNA-binding protein